MSNYNYRKTTLIIKIVVHQHPLSLLNSQSSNSQSQRDLTNQGYVKKKGCNCNKTNSLFGQ